MTQKSMLIIGAGVAGLCTGSYAQMNGFSTRILELHSLPGGLCTNWKRGNYTVDGCLHWLVGSSPVNPMYHLWEELGVVQNHKFLYLDEFLVHEGKSGKALHIYRSLDRLEQHMLEYAPEDAKLIREFIGAARDMKKVEMPVDKAQETMGMMEGMGMMLKMMPKFGLLRKWGSITAEDYTKAFKNRELAEAINESWLPDFSLLFLLMTLAWLDAGDAGYALGGSLPIARTLEARYKSLGGDISYQTRVKKIIVENDKAVGVVLEDGTELRADIVVSCADGFHTIWDMLGGKYLDEKITKWYKETPIFQPLVHVALGCNRDFADVPHVVGGISIPIPKPLVIGEQRYQRLPLMVYNFDPGYAPSGKTVIKVMVQSRYDYWQKLAGDEKAYEAEKERIAREIVEGLESRFPGITNQIEMTDVATPLTFERYTGNWQGSFEGWMMTPKNWMKRVKKTLPGLGNFYMAGQWVEPGGGLPGGLMSGRNVVQLICKDNAVKFATTKP
jgi:phytoene dehydrogenase-like protein